MRVCLRHEVELQRLSAIAATAGAGGPAGCSFVGDDPVSMGYHAYVEAKKALQEEVDDEVVWNTIWTNRVSVGESF